MIMRHMILTIFLALTLTRTLTQTLNRNHNRNHSRNPNPLSRYGANSTTIVMYYSGVAILSAVTDATLTEAGRAFVCGSGFLDHTEPVASSLGPAHGGTLVSHTQRANAISSALRL